MLPTPKEIILILMFLLTTIQTQTSKQTSSVRLTLLTFDTNSSYLSVDCI